ncbi:50S ribosomal protein L2 [Candidatus Peregrinibacteria bacterium]|nr:50S ribosomal protein L2 [Candidatus Peregrinibacteria bacterium]
MPIQIIKPVTPGRRQMSVLSYEEITRNRPHKKLIKGKKSGSGRNNQGKITVAHRGSGAKRNQRTVDFKQIDKLNIPAKVEAIEYDPDRNAFIMLVCYKDGERRYHLAPQKIEVGTTIITALRAKAVIGNRIKIKNIPPGFNIHNIELKPGAGGKVIRSAGCSARMLAQEGDYVFVEMPSGEMRKFHKECFATIGSVSNGDYNLIKIGKAGRKRHMGIRPVVRGKAKNPVDHPHGGGEGSHPIGLKHPKTPWGLPALGKKTRKRKKYSDQFIVRRRKKTKK